VSSVLYVVYNWSSVCVASNSEARDRRSKINEEDILQQLQYHAEVGELTQFLKVVEDHNISNKTLVTLSDDKGKVLLMVAAYCGTYLYLYLCRVLSRV
jgi:hypothetical protein